MEAVIFMFCLTLHNVEEALWLTDWKVKTFPNNRNLSKKEHFVFAVIGVTVLGYLAAGLHLFYPDAKCFEYVFIGFIGAMLINAVIPHLLFTIIKKKYCPGVLTGCCLIIPFHIVILKNAVSSRMNILEILLPTIVIGLVLLISIKIFEAAAKRIFD